MNAASTSVPISWRVFGAGVMAIAVVGLVVGDFVLGQSVPKDFPARVGLAYAAAALTFVAGAGVEWRRTVTWCAAALVAYYGLVVVLLMNGRVILRHPSEFGAYSGAAEELAITAGALIVYATNANLEPALARQLTRGAQLAFALCAILFGGAHFFYMNLTAPLVPGWLPPSQEFWGYATGVAHIAAGVAIAVGIKARLAAVLLTIMYACFTPLVHIPTLIADSASRMNWTENAVNLALTGVAWVVADSLGGGAPPR